MFKFSLLGEAAGVEVDLQDDPQDALLDVLHSEDDHRTENCKSGSFVDLIFFFQIMITF